jgi:hypothetical protein
MIIINEYLIFISNPWEVPQNIIPAFILQHQPLFQTTTIININIYQCVIVFKKKF